MESELMARARALVAAVPQRVWTAVAGLVLLASLGVTLVLAAGLATWQGAVGNSPSKGNAQPPGLVVTPPGSAVIVVPTAPASRPAAAAPPHPSSSHPSAGSPAVVSVALPAAPVAAPVTVPVVTPPNPVTVPSTPVTATPRVKHGAASEVKPAHKAKHVGHARHAKSSKRGNHGRHLGRFTNKHGKHS
jgi:hypothetical protein